MCECTSAVIRDFYAHFKIFPEKKTNKKLARLIQESSLRSLRSILLG